MTVYDDLRAIRERLECAKPGTTTEALEALERIEAILPPPTPTAGDQFRSFPIGQEFTPASPDTYVFVKTGETSAVRFHKKDHTTGYYPDVFTEEAFSYWDEPLEYTWKARPEGGLMGKKADRQAAARLIWAAEKIIEDAAPLIPYGEDGSLRNRVLDMANDVRLLAADVHWGREDS